MKDDFSSYAAGFCISHLGVVSSLVDKLTLETYISKTEPELLQRNMQLLSFRQSGSGRRRGSLRERLHLKQLRDNGDMRRRLHFGARFLSVRGLLSGSGDPHRHLRGRILYLSACRTACMKDDFS